MSRRVPSIDAFNERPARLLEAQSDKKSPHFAADREGWLDRVKRSLGLSQSLTIDGVRYRKRPPGSIRGVLKQTPDVRPFEVRFSPSDGQPCTTMQIRATPFRVFADLSPSPRLDAYRRIAPAIRPGMRVLELGCGTGEGSSLIGSLVGSVGGLVALDHDRESIRFARRRYSTPSLAFEIGGRETLGGELDGAFDVCVITLWNRPAELGQELARESWRVLADGGLLAINAGGWQGASVNANLAPVIGAHARPPRMTEIHAQHERLLVTVVKKVNRRKRG